MSQTTFNVRVPTDLMALIAGFLRSTTIGEVLRRLLERADDEDYFGGNGVVVIRFGTSPPFADLRLEVYEAHRLPMAHIQLRSYNEMFDAMDPLWPVEGTYPVNDVDAVFHYLVRGGGDSSFRNGERISGTGPVIYAVEAMLAQPAGEINYTYYPESITRYDFETNEPVTMTSHLWFVRDFDEPLIWNFNADWFETIDLDVEITLRPRPPLIGYFVDYERVPDCATILIGAYTEGFTMEDFLTMFVEAARCMSRSGLRQKQILFEAVYLADPPWSTPSGVVGVTVKMWQIKLHKGDVRFSLHERHVAYPLHGSYQLEEERTDCTIGEDAIIAGFESRWCVSDFMEYVAGGVFTSLTVKVGQGKTFKVDLTVGQPELMQAIVGGCFARSIPHPARRMVRHPRKSELFALAGRSRPDWALINSAPDSPPADLDDAQNARSPDPVVWRIPAFFGEDDIELVDGEVILGEFAFVDPPTDYAQAYDDASMGI